MSNELFSLALQVVTDPAAKAVLLVLADAARSPSDPDRPSEAWPPVHSDNNKLGLVERTCLSERTVQRAIIKLVKQKHITRRQVRHGVIYTVHPTLLTPVTVTGDTTTGDTTTSTPVTATPKPLETIKPQKTSSSSGTRARKPKFAAPAGVDEGPWADFQSQRKKPLQERGYQLLCAKLGQLAEDGWPPGDMIDRAIERGWETVFEPKDQQHGKAAEYRGRPSGWAANPKLNGAEPASLDDWVDR